MALIKSTHAADAAREAVVLDLGDLRREAERLRGRARAEADRIVEEARDEAGRLTAGAEERGRAAGFEAGHAEGLEAGREAGRAEALREMNEALERLQGAWVGAAQQWDGDRRRMVTDARQSLLGLAVAMAGKIVRRAVRIDPSLVIEQVAEAIEHVARPCDVAVRIHPDDRPLVEQALPRIAGELAGAGHVSLLDDPEIARGGCVVTHGRGRIDATLDKQLDRLIETLLPAEDADANPDADADPDLNQNSKTKNQESQP